MKLYHITPKKNLESILTNGLIPGHKRGLGKGCNVIFLTDNPKFILNTQAGPNWIEQHKPVILEVDTELYVLRLYRNGAGQAIHEYVCKKHIKAKHIMHVRLNGKDTTL